MDNAALLSPTDVSTIRRYVQTKYAPLPGDRRAEIVADAIRRTLRQRLPDLPEQQKEGLVDRLITTCLLTERREIRPDDVLELCSDLADTNDDSRMEQLVRALTNWAEQHAPGRWNAEQVATRLERRKGPTMLALAALPSLDFPVEGETSLPATKEFAAAVFRFARTATRRLARPIPAVALAIVLAGGAGLGAALLFRTSAETPVAPSRPEAVVPAPIARPDVGMPDFLRYADFDVKSLKKYLNGRDSLLAEEPYFGAIVATAKEHDIHPLFLFAITGQEQGFVPKSSKDAKKIANNPFNVGHSWMEYNTDIRDSAGIASRFLLELAESRPEGRDPFEWFNRTYAEDPQWSDGVRKLFVKLSGLDDGGSANR
ncbi:hypothetical protein ACFPPD_02600 [Cohnella suwonensis]|uniref:Mannosyl-glycoprotein endo-beta-N-acetylglucosamidase-like domain-containing protein n=1 Tax=Cohnella suwonensis TaxID=696072 RepID=A0ABW0LQP5_9BACL